MGNLVARWVACRHDAQRRVGMFVATRTCRPAASPRDGMPPKPRRFLSPAPGGLPLDLCWRTRLPDNLLEVRRRIAAAAARSGRSAETITLVAVTKYVGAAEVRAWWPRPAASTWARAGRSSCGKGPAALADLTVRWHMIGHLQRNKVRRTLPLVDDDPFGRQPAAAGGPGPPGRRAGPAARNPAGSQHFGRARQRRFAPEAVEPLLEQLPGYRNLEVGGLMGMASLEGGPDAARRDFARLRQLRDRLAGQLPPGVSLAELSMGMSGDYEVAIEEGATIVRVGSALFEGTGAMIALEPHAEGTILPVRPSPGPGATRCAVCTTARSKVCVTQAPEKGKANKAIIALLAQQLGLRKSQVALLSGETSPRKRFLIRGVGPEELAKRIEAAVGGGER